MMDFIVRNRVVVLIGALLMSVAGIVAWRDMPIDAFPDATNQQVMILTGADGLGPLDVEQQISVPIESALSGLPHVRIVRSMSKTALSQVVVVFEDHVDTWFARQLVTERLASVTDRLPAGSVPELGPVSTGLGEIFQYTLESPTRSLTELRTLQDRIVAPRLRTIRGVNEVNSFGGMVRQIQVEVDPARLAAWGLTPDDVLEALRSDNANMGGGFVVKGWEQENIRNIGLFGSVEDIRQVVLKAENGTPVTINEVASVVEGAVTRLGAVSRDGRGEVAAGMVIMLKDENAAEVVGRVRAALPSIQDALPDDVSINVFYDRTELVDAVIATISGALAEGGLLVILILFLLLGNFRSAIVTALSIPITALGTFIFMNLAGMTANLMTIGGLAIAVGIVVDGPIVVVENVVSRLRRSPAATGMRNVIDATTEVTPPLLFSMLIILIVFVPLFTLEGMEGKMFKPLALTMVFSMGVSILVTLVIVPAILSWMKFPTGQARTSRIVGWLSRRYVASLDFTLRRKWVTIGLATAALVAAAAVFPRIGMEFLPRLDEGAIAINVVRLPNASLDGSVRTADYLEKAILEFPEVRTVVSKTGRAEISEDPMGPEQNDLMIMLHPESEWTTGRDSTELVDAIRRKLEETPGIRLAFSQPIALRVNELISGVKSDLAVKVFGQDMDRLKADADRIAGILRGIPGARDVNVEQVAGFSQLEIVPNRPAMARHGLRMSDINNVVGTAVGGSVATEFIENQSRVGISVRVPERYRNSPESIMALTLRTPDGAIVPLGNVASIRRVEGPAQISRENGMRRVVVEVNVDGRDLGGFVDDARDALEPVRAALPDGSWIEYGGTFESQQRAMGRLAVVIPISVLLIFVLLAAALKSVKTSLLVLLNLPFAVVGGLLAMAAFDIPFNVPATIGFIALFGVAVQNGLVLLAFVRQVRDTGVPVADAVKTACTMRIRALLMTALTTVLGLLPMIYATGPGADVQRPLAIVMNGGIVTSTVLTLFVLPTVYVMADGLRAPDMSGIAGMVGRIRSMIRGR